MYQLHNPLPNLCPTVQFRTRLASQKVTTLKISSLFVLVTPVFFFSSILSRQHTLGPSRGRWVSTTHSFVGASRQRELYQAVQKSAMDADSVEVSAEMTPFFFSTSGSPIATLSRCHPFGFKIIIIDVTSPGARPSAQPSEITNLSWYLSCRNFDREVASIDEPPPQACAVLEHTLTTNIRGRQVPWT